MTQTFIEYVTPQVRRLVLPMRRFASVNGWVIGRPGRQAIVDTGMPGPETASLWRDAERLGDVAGVEAIVCTHMHRDHAGQAAALLARHGARLFMSADEHQRLSAASRHPLQESRDALHAFLMRLGLTAPEAAAIEPIDYSMLAPFPEDFTRLEDGDVLQLGGIDWQIMLGGGHSSRAVSLLAEDRSLLLAGDQILPGLGPHITVWSGAPEADPLSDYFTYLDRLIGLPDTLLILPGHGGPFAGIAAHAAALRQGHERRLARLLSGIHGALTCRDMAALVFSERASQRFADLLPGMILSLANHLWHGGRLRRHIDDAGTYRFERLN